MLLHLIAFGIISTGGAVVDPGTGTVDVPASQTAVVRPTNAGGGTGTGIPLPAIPWTQPFDPADRNIYAFDWSPWLGSEKVASIDEITVLALGASLGVEVDSDADRVPIIDTDGQKIGLWFKVADEFKSNAAFSGVGTKVGVAMMITTDATPSKTFERTAVLTVQQQ